MMLDKSIYSQPPSHNKFVLESKKLDLDSGLLGKCFGSKSNAPMNIAGLFVTLLLFAGIAVLFIGCSIPAGEFWKIIAPLMTMVMGYLFGKSSKDS